MHPDEARLVEGAIRLAKKRTSFNAQTIKVGTILYYWLQRESTPILVDFTEEYVDEIFAKGRNALILFTDDKEAAYYKVFAKAADKLQRNMFFVVSGTKGDGMQ